MLAIKQRSPPIRAVVSAMSPGVRRNVADLSTVTDVFVYRAANHTDELMKKSVNNNYNCDVISRCAQHE